MSTKGVYSALSGAIAQSQRLDTIANNIANVNTPSFKRDEQVFQEYLTANEKPPEVIQVPRDVASIESFYNMQGGDKSYVDSAGTYTEFTPGSLRSTGNKLDLAIDGDGFFEVATPQGIRMTRYGSLNVDATGQLVNKEGYPVLSVGEGGQDPQNRVIRVTKMDSIQLSENGDVYQDEELISKIAVIKVLNKDHLSKVGQSLYEFKKNAQPEVEYIAQPQLKQGFLELSNVNIVKEMTDMIGATRIFESTQKAISAYDSINDKLVNVIPGSR